MLTSTLARLLCTYHSLLMILYWWQKLRKIYNWLLISWAFPENNRFFNLTLQKQKLWISKISPAIKQQTYIKCSRNTIKRTFNYKYLGILFSSRILKNLWTSPWQKQEKASISFGICFKVPFFTNIQYFGIISCACLTSTRIQCRNLVLLVVRWMHR